MFYLVNNVFTGGNIIHMIGIIGGFNYFKDVVLGLFFVFFFSFQ